MYTYKNNTNSSNNTKETVVKNIFKFKTPLKAFQMLNLFCVSCLLRAGAIVASCHSHLDV